MNQKRISINDHIKMFFFVDYQNLTMFDGMYWGYGYPPVHQHRPYQIGLGSLVSMQELIKLCSFTRGQLGTNPPANVYSSSRGVSPGCAIDGMFFGAHN